MPPKRVLEGREAVRFFWLGHWGHVIHILRANPWSLSPIPRHYPGIAVE
jgi:hypothetical protein